MRKIKILAVTHDGRDAHSFWRFMGPLQYMAKQSRLDASGPEIEIIQKTFKEDTISWPELAGVDLLMLHRACSRDDLTMIQVAKMHNVPVWVDLDDWLFELPPWNPGQNFYGNSATRNYIAHCLAVADVVTVTGTELYNRIRKINPTVIILPNAYRSDIFDYRDKHPPARESIALWRGTNTHDGDLISVQGGFNKLKGKIHFLGSPSWSVLETMPQESYATLTMQDFTLYFMHIYKMRPKVFVFPLADCLFNRCKSNIAWIEALHAGALCVAPNMPEWKRPGCVNYTPGNSDSFAGAVNEVLEMNEETHRDQVDLAFSYMQDLYGIKNINSIRQAILMQVIDPDFKKNPKDPYDQLLALWALSQLVNVPMVKQGDEQSIKEKEIEQVHS